MRALVISSMLLALAAPSMAKPRAAKPRVARTHAIHPREPAVDAPEILLTFDDGPAFEKTEKVLDTLDAHGIKAVFFVNGWHFQGHKPTDERERELLREELRRGHAVGNHTVHHYFLCGKVYVLRAAQEIEENADLIEQATGIRPDLYRTPYGAHCKQLDATLASLGVKHTGWDIDPQDWKVRNAAKIEAYVERQLTLLHGRAIILFHDVQGETVKALPHILDWIDQENAARLKSKERPPIKILDYSYLIPEHKLVPPALDAIGRILIGCARRLDGTLRFWPRLAWLSGQV
ncbi:MAG TPA: polysaccharide deacetylase family protein [Polyangia bacterium]|nr:polysaccharide deacetylase family protein [Polyangia bacterium]